MFPLPPHSCSLPLCLERVCLAVLAGVGVRHQDADVLLQELGALVPEVVAQAGVGPQDAAIPPAGGAGTSCLLPSLECLIPGAADHVCCMVCHILSQNKISYIAQACERHFRDQKICKSTEIVFLDRFVPPRPEKLHLGGSLGRSHCVWGGFKSSVWVVHRVAGWETPVVLTTTSPFGLCSIPSSSS